ncbi:SpoIIE family protein phosphatase [Streptomyces sp. NPDC047061]|uniref:SpoIIE family protein phosphatase n=1 Tax=Streptomyces sp. NPDC047061 TaxID=3154605 RepID=UPI00340F5D8F
MDKPGTTLKVMDAQSAASWDEAGRQEEAAFFAVDEQGRITAWSIGAEGMLGYSTAEAMGRRAAELLASDVIDSPAGGDWKGMLSVCLRGGLHAEVSAAAHETDIGTWEWLLTARSPERLSPDTEDQALSDWLLSQSPVALTVYDSELRCVLQNAAMRRLTGMRDEERLGRGLVAVLNSTDLPECEARMRRVLATGRAEVDFVVTGRIPADPDHDRVFSVSVSPVPDRHGRILGVCTTVVDITEQRRSRERLALLNEASTYIGSTLDVPHTAQELTDLAVPRLADFATVDLLEPLLSGEEPEPGPVTGDAVLRRVAQQSVVAGAPESVTEVGDVDVYPANSPPARCLAVGRPELHSGMDTAIRGWLADDPARAEKVRTFGFHSWLIVPVTARGTTLGVVFFGRWRRAEPFDQDDVTLAEELVARAAVCLDNARRFTRERAAAHALQRSLLPRKLPQPSAVEVASSYLPANPRLGVGGDWYDVIPLSGARVALVVGNAAGPGLQAAATMGQLRSAVRTLADVDLAPDELLTQLDDLVLRLSAESGTYDTADGTAAESGATCLYAVYDPLSGRCSLARAGHPAPVAVEPDGTTVSLAPPAGPRLGQGGLPFETMDVEVPEGSVLALFTEGLLGSGTHETEGVIQALGRALAPPADSLPARCDHVIGTMLPNGPGPDGAALLLVGTHRLGSDRVASWDVPADPAEVAGVRAAASHRLEEWGLEESAFVTELVVSELVTNAIRYGVPPIRLRLIRDRTLICEVSDGSSTAPHLRRARVFDEGGRGLLLVAQLTDRWGSRQHARGKTIWCEQTLAGG